ncbi:DNA-processing protein DprA [Alteromonas halophila]|uniref:DNA protecting protein DprA n=1 Tax=Alteromonas halophila TaxID=516698 RepID=A0A918JQ11_9ALTE|nr:DNA-processing protein DprA [Alteromonas halophila]GGW96227.1 DNA protecting protein DprA [Alteromonas halophila]
MLHQLNGRARAWLSLASIAGVAPGNWLTQVEHFGTVEQLLRTGANESDTLRRLFGTINTTWLARTEQWLAQCTKHSLLCIDDENYPPLLKTLAHPPLVLFVAGHTGALQLPQLAIVGSRRASHAGKSTATEIARALSSAGIVVTSGLATGIDAAAHEGALSAGMTVAVMGTGPDRVYPLRNQSLYEKIIDNDGAVISEFFPGIGPRRYHFPRRNRIIAALSLGTLVVEATIKSGTLITANLAADLGREVFAIPGSIHHSYASGCHHLIKQGAALVTSSDDILDALAPSLAGIDRAVIEEKSEVNCLATDKLLASVNFDVTAIDVIAERNALPVNEVMAALLEYELRGWVAAVPGGYVKLRGK